MFQTKSKQNKKIRKSASNDAEYFLLFGVWYAWALESLHLPATLQISLRLSFTISLTTCRVHVVVSVVAATGVSLIFHLFFPMVLFFTFLRCRFMYSNFAANAQIKAVYEPDSHDILSNFSSEKMRVKLIMSNNFKRSELILIEINQQLHRTKSIECHSIYQVFIVFTDIPRISFECDFSIDARTCSAFSNPLVIELTIF